VIAFHVTQPDATWRVDLASPAPGVTQAGGQAATTLTLSDSDLTALVKGEADVRTLYQHGKLRVDGDVRIARRLGFLNGLI
jgi:3-hydroxyacyl-CoA dehydrogenase/3a,7a,12a-trihydroxy-5b-cholest-24-enoyl-CoA hydratase